MSLSEIGGLHHRHRGEDGDRFKLDEILEAEAQLLGRVTFQGFAEAWPKMTDEAGFAEKMNGMPKCVVSSTLKEATWDNSTIPSGDLVEEVTKLKQEVDGVILVAGSATLVQGLAETSDICRRRVRRLGSFGRAGGRGLLWRRRQGDRLRGGDPGG